MSCLYHSDRSAVNTCSKCGAWLCDGCSVEIDGRVVCKTCISRELGNAPHAHTHSADPRAAYTAPPAYGYPPAAPRVNIVMMFFLSALPGANYMYMGLIKRGLCVMAAFFASIYATAMFGGMPFAFIIPILAITSMFDGFRIRRLINAGESVPDNIDDVREFIRTHRAVIFIAIAAAFAFNLMDILSSLVGRMFYFRFGMERIVPWLFIGLGAYFLFRRRRVAPRTRPSNEDDPFAGK